MNSQISSLITNLVTKKSKLDQTDIFGPFTWTAGMHLALQQTIPVPTIAKNVPIKPATMLNNKNARLCNGLSLINR